MTLARQFLAGISVAFIALLVGIEAIYVSTARSNLEQQLDAHANETATSLALSLGARAGTLDASIANIMVNPVFDRGHFESIEVRSPGGEVHSGALALFFVTGLEEVNRVFGLTRGNEILKHLADALAAPGAHGTAIVGRWQGPTLAAFLPNLAAPAAVAWADALCRSFSADLHAEGPAENVSLASGLAHFNQDTVALAALAQAAESALTQAVKQGGAVLAAGSSGAQATGADLKQEIESAIAAKRITLLGQKVISLVDAEVLQVELLASLTGSEGEPIPAATFVPIASQYGLLPALDAAVIKRALVALERVPSLPWAVSVNVSMQSIGAGAFRAALKELLAKNKPIARRLVIEVTGYAASRSPELIKAFAAELHRFGVRVAFDNFELDRNSMAIMHELLPAYVKLAPAFTQEIAARDDLRFIVEAMVRMLRPLEIPLIAQGVEDASHIAILAGLGLTAYQGYAGGRPEPLSEA